ncbi:hypothetical protein ACOSQ3_004705 [Xanthoceras sorbifolium]
MKGFMCHSTAATAVCIATDPRSVHDHTRLITANAHNRSIKSTDPHHHHYHQQHKQVTRPKQSLTLASSDHHFQVVVMRVSLHCQGCAGKVKKHISKMEGVTSFSIDLETKRVTVMGYVSPIGVLESISKVKKAEFWSC